MSSIDDIRDGHLWCRDVLHSWNPYSFIVKTNRRNRRREMHQTLSCIRCGTLKTRIMTTAGDLLRHQYSYPDGYLLKGQGRMTKTDRATIRRRNIERNEARA